jgi:hypothetical protein
MVDLRYPSLYQINTCLWLTELAQALGRPATLDDIPNAELDRLPALGFDWVWFLSVWHAVDAVLHLDWLLWSAQVRDKITIFLNANNTFSFDRIGRDRTDPISGIGRTTKCFDKLRCHSVRHERFEP